MADKAHNPFENFDELYEVGVDIQRKAHGDARAGAILARRGSSETSDWITAVAWRWLIHRTRHLGMRERAIVMITNDIAQGVKLALEDHVRFGLYAGLTREEIQEICLTLNFYLGFPATREGSTVINALFAKLDEEAAARVM